MNEQQMPSARTASVKLRRKPLRDGVAANRVRMSPETRVDMILTGAVAFFAKHGFTAQTRELAREIGVSQSLIYHYFSTKEELVERVYERTFISRWRAEWEEILRDRSRPLASRLKEFYASYLSVIDDNDWIRIVMFSGLEGSNLAHRYVESQINGILRTIARELAVETANENDGYEPDDVEMELVWHLHSTFIYYLVRKHILKTGTIADTGRLIEESVDHFLRGAAFQSAPTRSFGVRAAAASA